MSFINELKGLPGHNEESLGMLADAQDIVDTYLEGKNLNYSSTCKIIMMAAIEVISRVPLAQRAAAMSEMISMVKDSMRLMQRQLIGEAVEQTLKGMEDHGDDESKRH